MYLVAYDIANDKERSRVARCLEDYGMRVQKSVWLCDISNEQCHKLSGLLKKLKVETGFIDIWQTKGDNKRIGNQDYACSEEWIHFF